MTKKIHGKNKGNNFERRTAKLFRDLGYNSCTTSRFSSKEQDDLKIDLCGTGVWAVQCKAQEQKLDIHSILDSMPKNHGKYNLLFHKRNRKGTVVAMSQEDFLEILQILIKNKIFYPENTAI